MVVGRFHKKLRTEGAREASDQVRVNPLISFLVRTIGTVYGNLLQNCGSVETHAQEMSERCSESFVESGLVGSSQGSTWRE